MIWRSLSEQRRIISPQRRGYSLVEMLLAVAIVSIVLSAVAVAMQAMYRVDRQLKDNLAYQQIVPRLSLQLRADAHAARAASMLAATSESAGVVLTMGPTGERVEYQSSAGRVIRTHRRNQQELGREVFALGKSTALRWRASDLPSPLLELEIVRRRGRIEAADARQVDRIVAAIGLRITRTMEGDTDVSRE